MKKYFLRRLFLGLGVWGALGVFQGWAGNDSGQFESEISGKLTRGTVNTLFGWTELLRTPTDMAQGPSKNFLKVFFVGVPYGVFRAAGRTVLGVYEMTTCYAPQKPIMAPIEGEVV